MRQTLALFQQSPQKHISPSLQEALAQWQEGHALPRAFYKDPAIFDIDMQRFVMAHWHCVGHISMVPNVNDFFTVELAGESFIIAHNADHSIRALLNVCRHRGSRLCSERHGHASNDRFVCPYHAWTYDSAGNLMSARHTSPDFSRDQYALKQAKVHVEEGMIFITLAAKPLALDHVKDVFGVSAKVYGWSHAKVITRKSYLIQANWKLVEENYQECYHCGPAHHEYSRRHSYAHPAELRAAPDAAMRRSDEALRVGLQDRDFYFRNAQPGQESADCIRSAMASNLVTGSRDGASVAPLMGNFKGRGYDGGFSFIDVGPTSNFVAYPDYTLLYRTVPMNVDQTTFELIWLVDQDAVEDVDYRVEDVIWLWDFTSQEDKQIIELNQKGVNSQFYEPGPYTPMETYSQQYSEWYLEALRTPD